jgi:hypothetical protein
MRTIKKPLRRLLARTGDEVLVEDHGFVYLLTARRMTARCVCNWRQFRDGDHASWSRKAGSSKRHKASDRHSVTADELGRSQNKGSNAKARNVSSKRRLGVKRLLMRALRVSAATDSHS